MYSFLSDEYRKRRGSWSRVLKISCANCDHFLFYYQKDGPGILQRCYLDRMIPPLQNSEQNFVCPHCKALLGSYQPYKKEKNRPSIWWFAGAVDYTIVSAGTVQ